VQNPGRDRHERTREGGVGDNDETAISHWQWRVPGG
jgi:hypothetical protein